MSARRCPGLLRRRRGAWVAALAAVVLPVLALFALAAGTPAQAHALLVSTDPPAGQPLKRCPHTMTLHFTEGVATDGLQVTVNHHRAAVLSASPDHTVFDVDTHAACPAQRISLAWRTVSADDGHVAADVVTYPIRTAPPPSATSTSEPGGAVALAAFRALGYAALAALLGGLVFLVVVWPEGAEVRRCRNLLGLAVVVGLAATMGALAATVHRAGGLSWSAALEQPFGREYAALGLLWLLATAVVVDLRQRGRAVLPRLAWRVSAVGIGGAMVVVEAMTAHAFASAHRAIGLVDDVVHVLAMSVWIGGLLMLTLGVLPRRRLAELDVVVPRFSRIAKTAVGVVVATGLMLVALVVLPAGHVWGTRYGAVLGVKLGVLTAALVAATGSERWVRSRRRGAESHDRQVAAVLATIGAETVLALGILAAAGVLASSSPGV